MLTFIAATFEIAQTSDLDVKINDGGGAVGGGVEHLIPVHGDVQNSRISMVDHLNVLGELLLQRIYGIRYSKEKTAR